MEVLSGVPIAAGSIFDWIGTPVGQTWEAVLAPGGISDNDASFIGSSASGKIAIVRCERPAHVERIAELHWVSVLLRVRRTAIGGPQGVIAPRVYSGASYFQGESVSLGTAYQDLDEQALPSWLCDKDPATGAAWTIEAALAAEVGVIDLTGGAHTIRCTTITRHIGVLNGRVNAVRYPR